MRDEPDPALKGIKGGNCNRTACQLPNAVWYNHSTQKYYCHSCADDINQWNHKDALELFGHELCTKEEKHV
jgi:hypothetical protein